MGRDKLLLPLPEGGRMVDPAARALRSCCEPCFEVGRRLGLEGFSSLSDALPGAGPLAGLLAALEACPGVWVLALAGDLPGVETGLLAGLQEAAEEAPERPCAVLGPRGLEPLCSAWPRGVAGPLRAFLEEGERAVHRALRFLGCREWRPSAAPRLETSLSNLNLPEDWERWTGSPLPPPRNARA